MAVNEQQKVDMAGNSWRGREWLEIGGHGWKQLKLAVNGKNGCKWQEQLKIAGNERKWLEMSAKDWKFLEWLEMNGN